MRCNTEKDRKQLVIPSILFAPLSHDYNLHTNFHLVASVGKWRGLDLSNDKTY